MRVVGLGALLTGALVWASAGASPLEVSSDGRHLVNALGSPFLLTGDSAWSLFAQPTLLEAEAYLQDRADHGFNLVVSSLIEHKFTINPPLTVDGIAPFTGAPFATPNEAYFARADQLIDYADGLGIVLLLGPVYVGYQCTDEGWCVEIEAASLTDMRTWGQFLGERYADRDNIIWLIGGDADPTPIAGELREVVAGIRDYDSRTLISAFNHRETQAITYWPGETWIQVNNVFAARTALYQYTQACYEVSPPLPFFLIEGFYENEYSATLQQIRSQAYWTVLTGGIGAIFGNCPLWHFGYSSDWCSLTNWQDQLAAPGADQMTHFRALFESRRWAELVPDRDNTVLIAGAGTAGADDYVLAAAAADSSSIIAYVPTPRALTFDTAGLGSGAVRAWWYDPSQGTASLIGDYPGGIVEIGPALAGDQVLVLDDAALGFEAPGTPLATSAPSPGAPRVRMQQNHPNPFNPSTEIRFELAGSGRVELTVFDARGRVVKRLIDGVRIAGRHSTRWDGRDREGRAMGSGVYYAQIRFGNERATRKMILLK
jgi:hypothetical protein